MSAKSPRTPLRANSKPSLGSDDEPEYTRVESNEGVGEMNISLGGATAASASALVMWRLQKSSEESAAAQDRHTARKRRMDLTGSRTSTSVISSSGSIDEPIDGATILLLALFIETNSLGWLGAAQINLNQSTRRKISIVRCERTHIDSEEIQGSYKFVTARKGRRSVRRREVVVVTRRPGLV
jgi:hypothetical protein